jgi:hypothetical protein
MIRAYRVVREFSRDMAQENVSLLGTAAASLCVSGRLVGPVSLYSLRQLAGTQFVVKILIN